MHRSSRLSRSASRRVRVARWALAFALLAAAVAALGPGPAQAFCNNDELFGIDLQCDGDGHQQITEDGLPFLRPYVMLDIRDDLVREDREDDDELGGGDPKDDDRRHFDSCQFAESADYIRLRYGQILTRLDPAGATTARLFEATDKFGRLLHPVQDFYSHANWLDLLGLDQVPEGEIVDNPAYLLDATTGEFGEELHVLGDQPVPLRGDIVAGELAVGVDGGLVALPASWQARLGIYESVPTITTPTGVYRVLVTGWNRPEPDGDGRCLDLRTTAANADRLPGQPEIKTYNFVDGPEFGVIDSFTALPFQGECLGMAGGEPVDGSCPRTARFVHGGSNINRPCYESAPRYVCLHQDESGRPLFDQAATLARFQTAHEWCRLLHLARDEWGFAATSMLFTLFAKPSNPGDDDTPHPANTPCESPHEVISEGRGGPVELTVTPTRVNIASEWDEDSTIVFVLYTGDLRRSIAHVSRPSDRGSGDVATSELPVPVVTCVKPTDTVLPTVWAWDDPGDFPGITQSGEFDRFDTLRRGVTGVLPGPGFAPGAHDETSSDMTVRFDVRVGGTDSDGDGLTNLCGEPFYGTDPSDADTDDDGLEDGREANTTHTDPLVADTDDDALEDGCEVDGANPTDPLLADHDGDGLLDGQEDANHDCALAANETDPRDPDTDDDVLQDGCEVDGANPTSPLVADHDGDGLLDGQEDADHDCALDPGETNPRDADSDDDGLDDGLEVEAGTNPLNPDTDGDGIPDGSDVEWLQHLVTALPANVFRAGAEGLRTSILSHLDEAESAVARGNDAKAIKKLDELRRHLDGCGSTPDHDDWVTACAAQRELRALVDLLIANITA